MAHDLQYAKDIKDCLIHNSSIMQIEKIVVFSEFDLKEMNIDFRSKSIQWMRMKADHYDAIKYACRFSRNSVIYSTPFVKFDSNISLMKDSDPGKIYRSLDSYYIFHKETKLAKRSCIDDILVGKIVESKLFFKKSGYFSIGGFPIPSLGWKISKYSFVEEAKVIPMPISISNTDSRLQKKKDSDMPPSKNHRIDVVIVSVDYNDFLEITLERNRRIFDRITVVTSPSDIRCVEICEANGVNVVVTECMYSDGANFNKGKAINEGISSIEDPEFILLLDADIIVPEFAFENLSDDCIYYADRIMLRDFESFNRFEAGEVGFEVESLGPIGYFQLFRYKKNLKYSESSSDAAWSDVKFLRRFKNSVNIGKNVIHLGEDRKNWSGRVTSEFKEAKFDVNSYFDKIYCLNLDRRADRWNRASVEFRRFGIKADRFSAIDGRGLAHSSTAAQEYLSDIGLIENSKALGCRMSHIEMIKDAKSKGYEKILIFEDDVIISDDFHKSISLVSKMDWKIFYLGASQFDWNRIVVKDGYYHCRKTLGTFAYALDRSVYDEILEKAEVSEMSIDNILSAVQAENRKKCLTFFPNIVISDVSDSDIRNDKKMADYSISMRWDLDRFRHSCPNVGLESEAESFPDGMKNILLVPDIRGWAFDNIAKAIVKYNPYPDRIRYDIVYINELEHDPDLDRYDYAYVFFEAERLIPDGPKIIRGCYSAFWIEDRRFTPDFFGKIFSECRGAVFANEYLRDSISRYLPYGFPIATIHDSADENHFYPMDLIKGDRLRAIFVGNTKRKVKRFDEIVEICESAGVELIVCTDIKNDELVNYYNLADVCINFSDSEGGPQTFIESSLCEVPMLIRSSNSLSKIIPCFTGETKQDFIDVLKKLNTKKGRKKCRSVGKKARSVALELFTYSKTAKKFADFFLGIDEKKDLSEELTVFIIRCGENPNYENCKNALEGQTVSFRIEEIRDVAPMSLAFQNMIDRCETEYYIQVDEDMILENGTIDRIYRSLVESSENISTVAHMLRDVHLDFNIFGIKGYKHSIMSRYPYNLDIISCEMEQISRLQKDGYETMMVSEVVGLHSPEWTNELIFERYFDLMEKWKNFKYHWLGELPAKLLQIFSQDPSEQNLYALMGAMSSISSEKKIRKREKNFMIKDENFERISQFISKKNFLHIKNDDGDKISILPKEWSGNRK